MLDCLSAVFNPHNCFFVCGNLARSWNSKSVFDLIFHSLHHNLDVSIYHLVLSVLMVKIKHLIQHLVLFLIIYAWIVYYHRMLCHEFLHDLLSVIVIF